MGSRGMYVMQECGRVGECWMLRRLERGESGGGDGGT